MVKVARSGAGAARPSWQTLTASTWIAGTCACGCGGVAAAAGGGRGASRLEDREDLVGGGQAVGGGVELGAEGAQRQVGLRCADEHEQAGAEVQVAVGEAQADLGGDHRDGHGRDELEREAGQERQPQGGHRGAAVLPRDLLDPAALGLRPAEDPQRRKSADHVVEVVGEGRQSPPALRGLAAGGHADQGAEQRDERQRARDDDPGDRIGHADRHQHRQRDRDGADERGQVAGEIAIEPVQAGGGELGERGRCPGGTCRWHPCASPGRARRPGRAARPRSSVFAAADARCALACAAHAMAALATATAARTRDGRRQTRQCRFIDKDPGYHRRQQPRLRDHEQRGRQAEPGQDRDRNDGAAGVPEQPRVEWPHVRAISNPSPEIHSRINGSQRNSAL